jgi:putative endonuclease
VRVRNAVGAHGERIAVRLLEESGYAVLDRNWRRRSGELDVVAVRGGVVVFVEVKCRRSAAFGPPSLGVTPAKAVRIRALAGLWLAEHGLGDADVRFDVVSVLVPRAGAAVVEHLEGAF